MSKKYFTGALVLALVSIVAAQPAFAAIKDSMHDFKNSSWNASGETCKVCHTPHNANSNVAPFWGHAVSTATYTVYSSPTLNASVGQPSSTSKACLSCHDGTVAVNSFGGNTGTSYVAPFDRLGTDISNDHPVSFTYDTALANTDGGLYDPATKTVSSLGKTIRDGMLVNNKVECSSCHDIHKTKGYSASSVQMLLVNNSGSALCFTCHNK